MQNHSYLNFRENLEMLLNGKSYAELALYLDVPLSTLKSWINGNRCPTLKNIDKIVCYSSDLLNINSNIANENMHSNDLHYYFVKI